MMMDQKKKKKKSSGLYFFCLMCVIEFLPGLTGSACAHMKREAAMHAKVTWKQTCANIQRSAATGRLPGKAMDENLTRPWIKRQ